MKDEVLESKEIENGKTVEDTSLPDGLLKLRPYQQPIFRDHRSGIVVLHWARQIGKSYVLAAWAVFRLLHKPGRLVTVLSNSRENGAEFLLKCSEIYRLAGTPFAKVVSTGGLDFDDLRMELRIRALGKTGRIKVLAANPRTARGFSGDLILDEFAYHEDGAAVWAAAEPILASNPDFLCRIASTGNGRHNMFFKMAASPSSKFNVQSLKLNDPEPSPNFEPETLNFKLGAAAAFKVSRVTRTMAHALGTPVYDPQTREPITPDEARARAVDKQLYDQNFECAFADESFTLLSHELISAAENAQAGFICEQDWSADALALLRSSGRLYAGFDVGRKHDLSVITVLEKIAGIFWVRGILRLREMRLPDQQLRLGAVCQLHQFQRVSIDLTGLGLGLFEYAENAFRSSRVQGINFASTVPISAGSGGQRETVRITESLATELLRVYEDRRIRHPCDARLRDDLRKPEKITSPGGRVSIAATRDEAGHADHFWSLALAIEAAANAPASDWTRRKRHIPLYPEMDFTGENRRLLI